MAYPHYTDVLEQYEDTKSSIIHYISNIINTSIVVQKYIFSDVSELYDVKRTRLEELEYMSSLVLLASIEAMLQDDYSNRVRRKRREPLSRVFRHNYQKVVKRRKFPQASLGRDILPVWKQQMTGASHTVVMEVEKAFKYRHWLAHGRYWTWKRGVMPSFYDISVIAQSLERLLRNH